MKVLLAGEKSEYAHCLLNHINHKNSKKQRDAHYKRMQEIEKTLKDMDDKIEIIITTKKTNNLFSLPTESYLLQEVCKECGFYPHMRKVCLCTVRAEHQFSPTEKELEDS